MTLQKKIAALRERVKPTLMDGYKTGIVCICSECEEPFILTSDRDTGKDVTHISIDSCESGGVYGAHVHCPHCQHDHDLY